MDCLFFGTGGGLKGAKDFEPGRTLGLGTGTGMM
jgi:hypothetical protein